MYELLMKSKAKKNSSIVVIIILFLANLLLSQVSLTLDKSVYYRGEVIYLNITNVGNSNYSFSQCSNFLIPLVFRIYDKDGNQIHLFDQRNVSCTTFVLEPNDYIYFAWNQENFVNNQFYNNLKSGIYTVRVIDSNGKVINTTNFRIVEPQADRIVFRASKKNYMKGEKIEFLIINNATYDVEYLTCNLDLKIYDKYNAQLNIHKPNFKCNADTKKVSKNSVEVVASWNQEFYDLRANTFIAEPGDYRAEFLGFSTSFTILPEEELGKKFSIRTNKYQYENNEEVEIYLTNLGNINIQFSVCGINELKIFDENRKQLRLHEKELINCQAKATVLPGKTVTLATWNLTHYLCDQNNKCYRYKVPGGKYYIQFENNEIEIMVKTRSDETIKEKPPFPSLNNFKLFNITLKNGWNMISLPMIGQKSIISNNCSTEVVFEFTKNSFEIRNISNLEHNKGYFAYNFANECTITFIGNNYLTKSAYSYKLNKGWNLIGSSYDVIRKEELKGCSILSNIITYSNVNKDYVKADYLEPGKAYWILVNNDCDLKIG
ncbi:MAG: hypothetical protein N3E37_00295 [Candidatus Micrarchaeota archaeon]|nr:hypothetical protein [Candidatus Micrarchaeota archaeon]